MTPASQISVCIITRRRPVQLRACLDSLAAQVDAPTFEVIVCANNDPAVDDVVRSDPRVSVIHVGRMRLGAARNVMLGAARGDLLLFLDDDVVAGSRLLRELADIAAVHPDDDVFGGPNLTPPGSSRFQVVQGAVLGSFMGSGPVRRRYGRHPAGPADERFFTLCNLAVRRDAMRPFSPNLTGGEENALLIELRREHHAMRYDPNLEVFHERRATLRMFTAQMVKYGRGRGEVIRRDLTSIRFGYVAPVALIVYLLVLPVLVLSSRLALFPLALYGGLSLATGVRVGRRLASPVVAMIVASALIPLVHVAYGAGLVSGVFARSRRASSAAPSDLVSTPFPNDGATAPR